jgi:hypothetical protein
MTRAIKRVACSVASITLTALLVACDSGPSDSEFITACLAEGERGANKMMRREMGVKSEDFCKCGAKEARSAFSPQARQAMVLGMLGKKAEAHAIGEKMSAQEQDAFMKGTMTIFTACAGKPR